MHLQRDYLKVFSPSLPSIRTSLVLQFRGNWQGGQAQYMPVPFADFNLLKVDNKQKAIEHMMDIVLLSDVLPTGYNAAIQAEVCLGKTVYIAGAGTAIAVRKFD